jgi:LacI family transcriptional regulator
LRDILPKMAATLKDIAESLDVSVVTVSKVLRNQGKISAATRERVLQRAKELNYQMNWVARSLVTRRTFTVGLLLPEFTHPFFAEIARAAAQTLRPHGYHVITSYFDEDPALELSEADALLARQVDGLIIATAQPLKQLDMFLRIQARDVPYILVDRPIAGLDACFVGADNMAIGRLATDHLIDQGCLRIGHLRGPAMGIASERFRGYRQALTKAGMRPNPQYVVDGGRDDATGYEAMKGLLKVTPLPDGMFCFNDPVAIGASKAIREAGLRVPEDIALVGAGNVHYSDQLAVPLTTVDQGTNQVGTRAAELLLERIGQKRVPRAKTVLIPPKLVERESTRRTSAK